MYIVSQKFFCACEDGWFLMCGKWESCIHDILGSTPDHKHTPLRVTCGTLGSTRDHKHTPLRVTYGTLGSIRAHKHTPLRVTYGTLGSTRDHKHTPLRVTCSTHYCTVTVTSALAFTQFLTEAKGFWLILYIYTQTHTHTHMHIRETDQGKLMSKSPALCRS